MLGDFPPSKVCEDGVMRRRQGGPDFSYCLEKSFSRSGGLSLSLMLRIHLLELEVGEKLLTEEDRDGVSETVDSFSPNRGWGLVHLTVKTIYMYGL